MSKGGALLKETFQIGNSPHSVLLFQHQLTWCPKKRGTEDMSEWMKVRIQDILAVELLCKNNNVSGKDSLKISGATHKDGERKGSSGLCGLWDKSGQLESSGLFNSSSGQHLTIHFSQRVRETAKWTRSRIQLSHADYPVLNTWHQALTNFLSALSHRPRSLLFFVNPYGGKRKGVQMFERQVKPLLQLCDCKATVINTQRRNHATEALASMSDEKMAEYDVVVGVGGDGTICEVVTGLLTRGFAASKAIDEGDLQPASIPVAVIPAGSSNALAFTLHGTDDPQTAIIHILLGSAAPLDVAAIHNHSGISRFIVGQMSYGHLADTMVYSERLRWMGPKRYDVAGFRKFMSHATYEGSVDMRVCVDDSVRKIPTQCVGGNCCDDCVSAAHRLESKNGEWKRVEGKFLGISGANISCRCALSPLGMAPFAHLADGHIDLILIRKASRLKHLQYLLRTAGDSRTAFALPFVERYKVDEFIFTPVQCCKSPSSAESSPSRSTKNESDDISPDVGFPVCGCDSQKREKMHSVWNCDGELWYQPSVRVTVHRNLIRIMTRTPPEPESHSGTPTAASSVSSSPPLSPTGSESTVPVSQVTTPNEVVVTAGGH